MKINLRKITIFIISLPLLFLAIGSFFVYLFLIIITSPLLLLINIIDILNGKSWDFSFISSMLFVGINLYCETTGLFPKLEKMTDFFK